MPDHRDHYLKRELYRLVQTDPKIFDFLQDGSVDGIWYWDVENPSEEWLSPRFKGVFGYADDEVPNTSNWWQENIHLDDLQVALHNFEKHKLDPSHPYDQIVRYRHKDGSTVWVRCRGIAIRNEKGEAIRFLGAHTDLTSLKRAEEKLREQVAVFANSEHVAHIGNWDWNIVTDEVRRSEGLHRILGMRPTKTSTSHEEFIKVIYPADTATVAAALDKTIKHNEPYNIDFRIVRPDGEVRVLHEEAEVTFDKSDNPIRMVGISQDVTARVKSEGALAEGRRRLGLLMNSVPALISYIDREQRFQITNTSYERLFGLSADQIRGKQVREVLGDTAYQVAEPNIERALSGEQVRFDNVVRNAAGEERHLNATYVPGPDAGGDVEGLFVLVIDDTERKKAEEDLQRAHDDLETRVEQKAADLREANRRLIPSALNIDLCETTL